MLLEVVDAKSKLSATADFIVVVLGYGG